MIVLAGAGDRAFVSGADISEFESRRSAEEHQNLRCGRRSRAPRPDRSHQAYRRHDPRHLHRRRRGIALNTDVRICSADSVFSVPAARLGLGYSYQGIKRLVDLVGPAFAKEIFFSANKFTAEDARIMGLVNRVVPEPELESTVNTFASTISGNAPLTIKAAKMAINAALQDADQRNLADVEAAIKACFASSDYVEGRRAFMEKRKPVFKGL